MRALLKVARHRQVTVVSLTARGRTLVFLHYVGPDLRDAMDSKVRRNYSHLYERPVRV